MTRVLFLLLIIFTVLAPPASSQVTAVMGASGLWNSPSSWDGGIIPAAGDSVIIPASAAILVINNTAAVTSLTVHGLLEISSGAGSSLHIVQSFINTGTTTNDGHVFIMQRFVNSGSVFGSGAFCVTDSTLNYGTMYGSFDFCDLSPPAIAPYIDINTGTFDSGISFCLAGPCSPASVQAPDPEEKLLMTQDAMAHMLVITFPNALQKGQLRIFDSIGRQVYSLETGNEKTILIATGSFPIGIYSVVFHSGQVKLSGNILLLPR